jgi:CotH protein/type IX secretion system substrate protein
MRGDEWEKPMSFSYFENEKLISTNYGGMRIHGSGSRDAAQKSLRFYARKKYGVNKFPNVYLPELDIENFDNFILRATMSDHSMALIKDAISMKCVRGLKFEQTYINPVVVYINGNYWGLHEVRNRFDEEYLGEKYNLVEDSIDIVSPVVFGNPWEAKYKRMKIVYDYIVEHDLSIDENYKYIEELFDIPQMIDYYIAETYFVNTDWPGNNFLVWTSETNQKYKPLFYDLDAGWRDREKDMIEYATQMEHNDYPNPSSTNVIFSKLLSNDEFKQLFIERALYLIENEFSYEKLKPIIDKYINQYRTEISRNIDRWHFPESEQRWQEILFRDYYEFARLRGCYYKQHLVAHFNLDDDLLCSQTNINDNKNLYITLSPNPANDYLTIDNFDSEEVAIIDIHGQEIIKINSNYNKKVSIDISNLAPSVYFIKIKNAILKFVKIK